MVAAQQAAKACPEDAAAHKWRVFRNLTEAKDGLGFPTVRSRSSERCSRSTRKRR